MKLSLALLLLLTLGGCATSHHQSYSRGPIVDMYGVDPYDYELDLADCRDYAGEVAVGDRTAHGVVRGAAAGAVLGAVVGNHETAERAAGVGAILGGVKAHQRARYEQARIVKNCLSGRGYQVLN